MIASHCLNLGLFFVCFAKEKMEDERTNVIRLHSFYNSVIAGFVAVVLFHFIDLVMGNEDYVYPAQQLITVILGVYAFSYASLKRKLYYGK